MKKYDIIHTTKVNDRTYHMRVGVLIVKDNGKMHIKLNYIPTGEWKRWLNCFEQKPKEEGEPF